MGSLPSGTNGPGGGGDTAGGRRSAASSTTSTPSSPPDSSAGNESANSNATGSASAAGAMVGGGVLASGESRVSTSAKSANGSSVSLTREDTGSSTDGFVAAAANGAEGVACGGETDDATGASTVGRTTPTVLVPAAGAGTAASGADGRDAAPESDTGAGGWRRGGGDSFTASPSSTRNVNEPMVSCWPTRTSVSLTFRPSTSVPLSDPRSRTNSLFSASNSSQCWRLTNGCGNCTEQAHPRPSTAGSRSLIS